MKEPWIKWCLLGLLVIAALAGVPILINECYKVGVGYITIWNAADVLSYYGTIVGAAIAVATIAVTITFNRKQIQRESYLKSEYDKWKAIEAEIAEVLDRINPQRVFAVGIDSLSPPNDNYGFILSSFQKYQLDCQIALDKLISFLSSEDYLRIEDLFKKIRQTSDICFEICDEERKIYQKIQDLKSRDSMLQMFEVEKSAPNSFSKEDLEYGMKVLRNTSHVQSDDLWEKIRIQDAKMVKAYKGAFRELLALNRETFDEIYEEIQKNADEILHFGRK